MARGRRAKKKGKRPAQALRRAFWRWLWRAALVIVGALGLSLLAYRWVDPPVTIYTWQEGRRLGMIAQKPVPMARIAPVMARAAVAAEDANFCQHWGFDMAAIRVAIAEGSGRGASTISQQVVKNVWLWHGRSWARKALEAAITPLVEAALPKRRILEIYLNQAEFDEGVFGVEAAAWHYFGVTAAELSAVQAARLAAVLPDPKGRSAARPSAALRERAAAIMDGAATIARDGRAACFED
ncbi:monofunctional biosynthetic peptidoglycan transglycosylase [Roseovarius sp. MBR-78]|uniref:monofunctional biosynthetic peptidoglycan transglycosylase n=1 Tax=Roseovarius sp. MBR-78 TaxID=3156460 RepID=UPI00339B8034